MESIHRPMLEGSRRFTREPIGGDCDGPLRTRCGRRVYGKSREAWPGCGGTAEGRRREVWRATGFRSRARPRGAGPPPSRRTPATRLHDFGARLPPKRERVAGRVDDDDVALAALALEDAEREGVL